MKVTTDACLFGAWFAEQVRRLRIEVHSPVSRHVLDIGTGTGLLSLMLAQKNPELEIDAIEIDEETSLQAKTNFAKSPWKDLVQIINADVKNYPFTKKYDVVFSNPPFYEKELKGERQKKNLALHDDGLRLPALLDIIKRNLASDGTYYLLLPYKRNEEVKKLLNSNGLNVQQIIFARPSIHHEYFRMMISGKRISTGPIETTIEEISIMDGNNVYTDAFILLLKDYYLHL